MIQIFSTNRADQASLEPVYKALKKLNILTDFVFWRSGEYFQACDLAVILGDRFETLELAFRLNYNRIPIVHLSGGDITEGSQDDCFRHAITKLSHLHFPTNWDACSRILQMGEEPWRVFMFGSPSADTVVESATLSREGVLKLIGLEDCQFVLVLLHPNTMGNMESELVKLEQTLDTVSFAKVFIGPNGDAGSAKLLCKLHELSAKYKNSVYWDTVSRDIFLSLMKYCEEMIGNSSSMLYEAPAFNTKTVFIGDRQTGRMPIYGNGHAASEIARVLSTNFDKNKLLRKKFVEITDSWRTQRSCHKAIQGRC